MKRLPHDPRFTHVNYTHTDLRKTFARARKAMRAATVTRVPTLVVDTVVQLKRKTK